ncbi:MAG: hypothetical protein JSV05_03570 [Candidatus Bathyarchaeota archaeon]|nr:MAG: hypothetical protein JSV05_03570 [Candidatus Bathyarchaeota archaeon]
MFNTFEAIILIVLAVIFYVALQTRDLVAIVLSLTLTTLLIAYSTLRRQTTSVSS